MITMEQQEYAKEKITWTPVDFSINQPCVELLEKKPKGISFNIERSDENSTVLNKLKIHTECFILGILPMLEEECMLPQGADKRLLQKLHDFHDKTPCYQKPRLAADTKFGISHFAGDVTYGIQHK